MVTCPIPPTVPLANTGQISCDREKSQKTIHKDGNIMIHGSYSWKSLIFDIFPCHRQLLMIRCSDIITWWNFSKILARDTLQWCYKEHDGVLNHQPHNCFLNRLFSHRSKKTSKLRVTGLYSGEFTGEFPTQRASNAENFSIWWRHHDPIDYQSHHGVSVVSTGLVLDLRPANERRYFVTTSLIGWAQA